MRILKSLLAILTARWFWTLLGSLLLAALIWFFGDLLALGELRPFESDTAKLVGILVVAVLWGLSNLFTQLRARRRNAGLVAELAAPAARPDPADAELAELARRFSGALEQLKQRRLGAKGNRRWLYQLPWYAMIGPPGSGKTTALVQSGLRFPLAQAKELRGVAGTRYCDWFFTDEAVLIDTAGRYTSQDSDRDGDAKAWRGFLELLRKRRPRQPLSGILVALAVTDLIEGQRGRGGIDHAAAVRARLTEIDAVLGMRLPVYLLLTKADLIAGFGEFFGQLGERERAQVWGVTLPYATTGGPDTAALEQEFGGLVERLDRMTPARLAGERDLERRALVMGFSAQVQSLVPDLLRFVEAAFGSSSFEAQPALRGVYLTSGTQAGTPVDRLAAAIGRSLGLPQEAPQPQASDRSFFLTRLLRDVVFAEASLAGQDLGSQRRTRALRAAAMAGIAGLLVAAVAAWTFGFVASRDRQLAAERALTAWVAQAEPIAKHRLAAPDAALAPVLPSLDQLAQLQATAAQPLPWYQRLGLSQQGLLEAQAGVAYRKALRDLLLPRLVLRLERQMAVRINDPDYLLEALKVYLMLGGQAPADGDLVAGWFALDLQHNDPALADPMAPHLAALAMELPAIEERPTLDAGLLARAQTTIAKIPLAKRAWEALLASDAVRELPPWTITEHAGPNASATLVRRSNRPLGAPVPGIFTHAGFYEVFLPILPETAQAALAENWVLGSTQAPEPSAAQVARLQDDLVKLYEDDAIEAWEGVLRDVTLAPMASLDQAVDATKALSGPNSPLKLLTQSIVAETSLAQPPPPIQPTPRPTPPRWRSRPARRSASSAASSAS
ncbi:MAG: type VI secretion system membrane subunit TssM [Geminicoccaceae bacterium]